ncbi:MAG: hypothetical protein R2880_03720 [Deinococcales bacterium]
MIYYAKSAEATKAYKDGLVPLISCLAYTGERCLSVKTGHEFPSAQNFLSNEDETWLSYFQALTSPDGIVRYQPWLFYLAVFLSP